MNQDEMLSKAKIGIMQTKGSEFLTTIMFNLKIKWEPNISTACVDGKSMWINPNWFNPLTHVEKIGLLAHECWHVALLHNIRGKDKKLKIWQYACDYVINNLLLKAGFRIPKGGLHDIQYSGMSTDEVYTILLEDYIQVHQSPDLDDIRITEDKETINDIQQLVTKAVVSDRMYNHVGSVPNELLVILDCINNPRLPWQTILDNHMNDYTKNDYSRAKINKRYFPEFHLPSLSSPAISHITMAIDVSGSITQDEINMFMTEAAYIHDTLQPQLLTILPFQHNLLEPIEITPYESFKDIDLEGGGGTYIAPVFDWINENAPNVIIIFTDGDFEPQAPPVCSDIIWVIKDNPEFELNGTTVINVE